MRVMSSFIGAAAFLILCGCQGPVIVETENMAPVFTAAAENISTKTSLDKNHHMRWNEDDCLTIFSNTFNQKYICTGLTARNYGSFQLSGTDSFRPGKMPGTFYAVFPYDGQNKISSDGAISLELPAIQTYSQNSFGREANTMVAVTSSPDDYFLPFKNLCGFLVIKLYGEGSVKSLTFKGNNGEKIAGSATVVARHNENPEITMSQNATNFITIDCGEEGAVIGPSIDNATEFWLCIPPVTFSQGFTISVTNDEGWSMVKSVPSSKTVERNIASSIPAIETGFNTKEGFVFIEDPYFKSYCLANFDKDGDKEISHEEAEAVEEVVIQSNEIGSLKGIECFTNLKMLDCSGLGIDEERLGRLTTLDLSKNTKLVELYCSLNQLTSLDVSNNKNMEHLVCSNNLITSLDISELTRLKRLSCDGNKLACIDFSRNPSLESLDCSGNMLYSLDISGCAQDFKSLDCSPMMVDGKNVLQYLYLDEKQSISGITQNRTPDKVPDGTIIIQRSIPDAVDLGLSVKWASFNVGASRPEGYGNYYAWGETAPKAFYKWENYKWCRDGYYYGLTKYCTDESCGTIDNKALLESEDDAAHEAFGGEWRIPTAAECNELVEDCDWEWTILNGVWGYKITSKKNDQAIFLPAAGYYNGDPLIETGTNGEYWSASVNIDFSVSIHMIAFDSNEVSLCEKDRADGRSIRAVCD